MVWIGLLWVLGASGFVDLVELEAPKFDCADGIEELVPCGRRHVGVLE